MGLFKPNIKKMAKALHDKDWMVRDKAVKDLGKTKDARAVEPLIQALNDEHWSVRWSAVEALGKIGDARVVELLIQALNDTTKDVRIKAAMTLGEIGGARVVEPLFQALNDENQYQDVRERAAEALAKMGDARVVDPLFRGLFDSYGNFGREALFAIVPNSTIATPMVQDAIDASGYSSQDESKAAVKYLCNTKSPVTSNLLILISHMRDISVTRHDTCGETWEEMKMDFNEQREMALEELARRGSPPYDPSAFLKSPDQKKQQD